MSRNIIYVAGRQINVGLISPNQNYCLTAYVICLLHVKKSVSHKFAINISNKHHLDLTGGRWQSQSSASGDDPGEPNKAAGHAAQGGAGRGTDRLEAARQVLLLYGW